ncbi:MAG: DUF4932 domain-containing protein [Chitinophagaceae bacterium]
MRKLCLAALLLALVQLTYAQALTPSVDKRIEILSIVSRLAGYEEYSSGDAEKYVAAIHAHFDTYKTDTLIGYAVAVREQLGIGFDAVMSFAVNLKQKGQKFSLQPNWQKGLDKRWTPEAVREYVRLLNQFYKITKAETFFSQQKPYYEKVTSAFGQVLARFNQSWYQQYYGIAPKDQFTIVVGCGNGGGNYGPSVELKNKTHQVYAIMGSWSFDKEGNPVFKEQNYLPTVIHEFNHSFINPLLTKHENNTDLQKSMQTLLDTMRTEMEQQAYRNWHTVLNESLVRASVVRYLMKNNATDQSVADEETIIQLNRGFLWMKDLVNLLGQYENNRGQYPTIDAFYPAIIDFFHAEAQKISQTKSAYESNLPRIAAIEPFVNGAQTVDPSAKEIIIRFDRPMRGKGYSINYGPLGSQAFPVKSVIGYTEDNKAIRLELDLKPNTDYEMVLTGLSFRSNTGFPIRNYLVKFRTGN